MSYAAIHDVSINGSSLPPSVDGQIRSYVALSVRGLTWARQYSGRDHDAVIRVAWWGQTDGGTTLKPPVAGIPYKHGLGFGADVRFPVRCTTTKLQHYLADARQLVLDVVDTSGRPAASPLYLPVTSHPRMLDRARRPTANCGSRQAAVSHPD